MTITPGTAWRRARARTVRTLSIAPLLAMVVFASCTGSDAPFSPRSNGGINRIAIRPQFIQLGGAFHSEPINRIHLIARAQPSQQVFADTILDVQPNDASWDVGIDLRLPEDQQTASVIVTIELVNHSAAGDVVQWSGATEPISVAIGAVSPPPPPVLVFPGPPSNLSVTGITVSPDSAALIEGDSTKLNAQVSGATGTPLVVWSTLDPSIAAVSASGSVRGLRNGVARVVAQAGPKADTALVRFSQRIVALNIVQDSVSMSSVGEEAVLGVRALDARGDSIPGSGFGLAIRDGNVAELAGASRVRARANGRTVVVATSTVQPALRDSAVIAVSQRVSSTTIAPLSATIASFGVATQMTASARDALGNTMALTPTWTSDNAAVMTVDANGLARSASNGIARITATFAGGATAVATLTVAQQPAAITVAPPTTLFTSVNDTVRLAATARDANGTAIGGQAFTWSTSDATVAVVDPTGLVRAVAGGTATITARSGTITGTAQVTLTQRASRVTISPRTATASSFGATAAFGVVVTDARSNVIAVPSVTWRTGNAAVATVNSTGTATAAGNGTTFVVAEVDGVRDSVVFSVLQIATRVTVQPVADSVAVGDTLRVRATAFDARNNIMAAPAIVWTTSAAGVATVNASGLVTGVAIGTADVTATSDGQAAVARIRVYVPGAVVVVATPAQFAFDALNQSVQLTAEARNARGEILPNQRITWSSTQPAIVTVDANGIAVSRAPGTASIIALADAVVDTVPMTVTQVAARVVLSPDSAVLTALGAFVNFTATVSDRLNNAITGAPVQFASLNPGIASVDAVGHVVALANGIARIRVAAGAFADTANVRVTAGRPNLIATSLQFIPADTFRVGTSYPVRVAIRNIGTVASAPSNVLLTANAVGAAPPPLLQAGFPLGAINPGDSAVIVGSVPLDSLVMWPDSILGTLTIDPLNAVAESNEADNVTTRVFHLVTPVAVVRSDSVATVAVGDSVQLAVQAFDRFNRLLSNRTRTWTSINPTIATVSATGRVRGLTAGTARIEVSIEGVRDTTVVTVTAPLGNLRTWTGAVSTNWSNAANWSPAIVPTSADSVFIPAVATQPALIELSSVGTLLVNAGAVINQQIYPLEVWGNANILGSVTGSNVLMRGRGKTLSTTSPLTALQIRDSTILTSSVEVNANLVVQNDLVVGAHAVLVHGNLTVDSALIMMDPASQVTVDQGASFNSGNSAGLMTNGVLTVAGNFTIQPGTPTSSPFAPSLLHKTVLNGGGLQNMNLMSGGMSPLQTHFNILEVRGPGGIVFNGPGFVIQSATIVAGAGAVIGGPTVTIGTNLIDETGGPSWRVENTIMAGAAPVMPANGLQTNLTFQTTNNVMAALQNDFTLTGNLIVEGTGPAGLDLNGKSVNVIGGVQILSASTLVIGAGSEIEMTGDLSVTGGALAMANVNGAVRVRGSANFIGGHTQGRLTAGVLSVFGNFSVGGLTDAFSPSGTHITVLGGPSPSHATFTTPGAGAAEQHFQNLTVANAGNVTFDTSFFVNGNVAMDAGATVAKAPAAVVTVAGTVDDPGFRWFGAVAPNANFILGPVVTPAASLLHIALPYAFAGSVTNAGIAASAVTTVRASVLHFGGAEIPVVVQFTDTIPILAPGATFAFTRTMTPDFAWGDSVHVVFDVDPAGQVVESNESDNSQVIPVLHVLQQLPNVTRTWIGTASSAWSDAGNWSPPTVPNSSDVVRIKSTAPNQPVFNSLDADNLRQVGTIIVDGDAQINVDAVNFPVFLSAFSDGEITGTGIVKLMGNGLLQGNFPKTQIFGNMSAWGDIDVDGDLEVLSGGLTVGAFNVDVNGDFERSGAGSHLNMSNAAGVLDVEGFAHFYDGIETNRLSAGTLYVGGEFDAATTSTSFMPTGSFTVVFDGVATQSVRFSGPHPTFGQRFVNVRFSGGGGVYFQSDAYINGNARITVGSGVVAGSSDPDIRIVLAADLIDESEGSGLWNVPITSLTKSAPLLPRVMNTLLLMNSGTSITLQNDLEVWGLSLLAGAFTVNGHTLHTINNLDTDLNATLVMLNPADSVEVGGSAHFAGGDETGLLAAGVLQVYYDFIVTGGGAQFAASGTHTVSLAGDTNQSVSLDNAGFGAGTQHLQNLRIGTRAEMAAAVSTYVLGTADIYGQIILPAGHEIQSFGPVILRPTAIVEINGAFVVTSLSNVTTYAGATVPFNQITARIL